MKLTTYAGCLAFPASAALAGENIGGASSAQDYLRAIRANELGLLEVSAAAYRRGAQFLLDNQFPDGSWYVRSRAVKLRPYFQSGFPLE
jgi:hypothetical protein